MIHFLNAKKGDCSCFSSTKPLSASPKKFAHSIDSVEKVGLERSVGQNYDRPQEPMTPSSPTDSVSTTHSQSAVARQAKVLSGTSPGSNASSKSVAAQILSRKISSSVSTSNVDSLLSEIPTASMTNGMTFRASDPPLRETQGPGTLKEFSGSSISDASSVDLLRKTVLESTESIKFTLQRELVKSQINSYNDYFQLKQMMEQLIAENQSMKREISELKESLNKLQARANLFS